MNTTPENRYHAPLSEKNPDELLGAIRRDQQDAGACRAQLHRLGWTDAHIAAYLAART